MRRTLGLSQFFGPASLVGVILGTLCLVLLLFGVYVLGVGFVILLVVGLPVTLTLGVTTQFCTGLVVSLATIQLTIAPILVISGTWGR